MKPLGVIENGVPRVDSVPRRCHAARYLACPSSIAFPLGRRFPRKGQLEAIRVSPVNPCYGGLNQHDFVDGSRSEQCYDWEIFLKGMVLEMAKIVLD
jgi:hypothetical protein